MTEETKKPSGMDRMRIRVGKQLARLESKKRRKQRPDTALLLRMRKEFKLLITRKARKERRSVTGYILHTLAKDIDWPDNEYF